MVQGLAEDRSSELATQFHDIAIAQAKPSSPPEDEANAVWCVLRPGRKVRNFLLDLLFSTNGSWLCATYTTAVPV